MNIEQQHVDCGTSRARRRCSAHRHASSARELDWV